MKLTIDIDLTLEFERAFDWYYNQKFEWEHNQKDIMETLENVARSTVREYMNRILGMYQHRKGA